MIKTKYNSIFESIFSLSVLNILNMLLPLITLPYLIKVVGLSNYGAYTIVYTILQYGLLISQYGFAYSATHQIAVRRHIKSDIEIIFNSTIFARSLLSLLAIFVMGIVVLFYNSSDYNLMYLLGIGIIIGDTLNPIWLFQGMEKMRYMTIVNILCKLLFTILIFCFIKQENDYIYITLLNSLGFLFSGIISYYIAIKVFKIRIIIPSKKDVFQQLKSGWYIFVSTIFMNIYRNSNVIILSIFVPDVAVGMYSGAEKMIKAAQSVASPISNAFYPYFANKQLSSQRSEIRISLIKLLKFMLIILSVISLCAFVLADELNELFVDPNVPYIATLMRIMSPVILIGGLNYVLGFVGLANIGKQKLFTKYVIYSGIVSLLFLFLFVNKIGVASAAWAMNVSEIVLFMFCAYGLNKHLR